eukprot:CAMPEP_0184701840 /NCGR_PEP_ID=MMETSP0313-20130426/21843_1 /TAXON_ID=2792 /ORGANISM="Porphyridium aerugineum, Strain SAG 1380-2" /LENGTH=458 /DNA_ID=CAMNT_0027162081 /DNA_START=84 /DNA_END=1460 /DNA_ORIENTATION=-
MKLVFTSIMGDIATIDVDPEAPLENIQTLVEIEMGIPANEQIWEISGARIPDEEWKRSLKDVSMVTENDVILVKQKANGNHVAGAAGTAGASASNSTSEDSNLEEARVAIREISRDRSILNQLDIKDPDLATAIRNNDVNRVAQHIQRLKQEAMSASMKQRENMSRMMADPMSIEAQEFMAEKIRMENVMKNFEAAMEHNPEAFAKVVMLFINARVNGQPVVAFVDSGAQQTIISKQCAARCNILHLMDNRFRGIAKGVGTAQILGRIHLAEMQIENQFLVCSFTVMEDFSYDILFGLDMLRKHQASIDLSQDCLHICGVQAKFLPEKDIPIQFRDHSHPEAEAAAAAAGAVPVPQAVGAPSSSSSAVGAAPATGHSWGTGQTLGGMSNPSVPNSTAPPSIGAHRPNSWTPTIPQDPVMDEGKVQQLMAMGFSRTDVVQALHVCNGDVEQAAALLFQF